MPLSSVTLDLIPNFSSWLNLSLGILLGIMGQSPVTRRTLKSKLESLTPLWESAKIYSVPLTKYCAPTNHNQSTIVPQSTGNIGSVGRVMGPQKYQSKLVINQDQNSIYYEKINNNINLIGCPNESNFNSQSTEQNQNFASCTASAIKQAPYAASSSMLVNHNQMSIVKMLEMNVRNKQFKNNVDQKESLHPKSQINIQAKYHKNYNTEQQHQDSTLQQNPNENTNNSGTSSKAFNNKKRGNGLGVSDDLNHKSLGKRTLNRSQITFSPPCPCDAGSAGLLGKLSGSNSGEQPICTADKVSDNGAQGLQHQLKNKFDQNQLINQQWSNKRSRIQDIEQTQPNYQPLAQTIDVIRDINKRQRTSFEDESNHNRSKEESIRNESSIDPDNSSFNGCIYPNQNSNKSADLAKQISQHQSQIANKNRHQSVKHNTFVDKKQQKSQKSSSSKQSIIKFGNKRLHSPVPPQQILQSKDQNKMSNIKSHANLNLENEPPLDFLEREQQMLSEIAILKQQLNQKETELEKKQQICSVYEMKIPEQNMALEKAAAQKKVFSQAIHKYLIQLEQSNRKQKRLWLNEQSFRLGRLSTQRQGARVWEFWEEGEAFRKINQRLREIQIEKEEIERLKSTYKKTGKNSLIKQLASADAVKKQDSGIPSKIKNNKKLNDKLKPKLQPENQKFQQQSRKTFRDSREPDVGLTVVDQKIIQKLSAATNLTLFNYNEQSGSILDSNFDINNFNLNTENGCEDQVEGSNCQNNIDISEQKEIYQFKLKIYENEERRLKEELQTLEKEKIEYMQEFKRMRDEEHSIYCGIHSRNQFTVLKDRYLILSILGKGGYSEVYRAFDLENCREVACKIHHFDNSWSEQVKDNYIKHAIRENEIHKDLNHRRVVNQYDTVEINHNSFCTILELCSGPDLYFYLKQNKSIPEKEAKLIISQILSGLKYLNETKQKIIHFDLKPQNIIFHNGEVKITDFGLCKIMDEGLEKIELTSQGVGTYWYQAPECFNQQSPQITQKVDIWSVGVIFFELLFGMKPFGNNQSQQSILKCQTILNAREVAFPQKPQISEGCKDFIRKCLAYHHQDRYDVYEAFYSPYLRGSSSQQINYIP